MAALAKAHEVVKVACAAVEKGTDMMTLRGWRQPALLQALLAQRVFHYVAVTNLTPLGTVTLAALRVTLVFVVAVIHSFLMLGAVPAVRQLRTAREPARLLRTSRHSRHLHSEKVKAL